VLQFCTICKIRSTQDKQTKPHIKAIVIVVDQNISLQCQQHIKQIYSTKAQIFPCGIKMCFIQLGTLTNLDSTIKAVKLTSLQALFLVHTETTQICGKGAELYNNLWQMLNPASHKYLPGKPLFHAISCMAKNEGVSGMLPTTVAL